MTARIAIFCLTLMLSAAWRCTVAVDQAAADFTLSPQELNDTNQVHDPQALRVVGRYLRELVFSELASDTLLRHYDNQWHLAKIRAVHRTFSSEPVKNFWLNQVATDQLENYGCKNVAPILEIFFAHCTDSSMVRAIRETYVRDSTEYYDHQIEVYKTVGAFALDAHIFKPGDWKPDDRRPVIVYLHGGSWYQGTPAWQFGACKAYAQRGMVAVAVEYRIYDRHGTSPLEAIADTKSAVRWLRQNADSLGIDPTKIVVCGASAGGHLALCAAMIDTLDESSEDRNTSSVPNALILYYACYDPTLDPWFVSQVQSRVKPDDCSPIHNVRSGLPPSLLLHGTLDRNCPYYTAQQFHEEMTAAGNRCELMSLEGAGHIFVMDPAHRAAAGKRVRQFLASLGYIALDEE